MPTQPPKRARDRGASAEDEDDDDDVGSEDEYDDDDGDDDDEDGESGGAKGGGSAFNWRQFIDDEAEQSDDGIDGEDDDGDDEVRALHKHVPHPPGPTHHKNISHVSVSCFIRLSLKTTTV